MPLLSFRVNAPAVFARSDARADSSGRQSIQFEIVPDEGIRNSSGRNLSNRIWRLLVLPDSVFNDYASAHDGIGVIDGRETVSAAIGHASFQTLLSSVVSGHVPDSVSLEVTGMKQVDGNALAFFSEGGEELGVVTSISFTIYPQRAAEVSAGRLLAIAAELRKIRWSLVAAVGFLAAIAFELFF